MDKNPIEKRKSTIQVLDRALDVLDILAENSVPMRASHLARKLGISPQSTGNILSVLLRRGMVSQDSERRYYLGVHCFYMGTCADSWRILREVSRPIIQALSQETGLCVFLGMLANEKLFCLCTMDSQGAYLVYPKQNWLKQIHSTACGRLLLSLMPTIARTRLLESVPFSQITNNTVTEPESLELLCRKIASQGFCEIFDESVKGVWSIAVPIITASGKLLGGLTLYGSKTARSKWSQANLLDKLRKTSARISQAVDALDGKEHC